MTPEELRTRPAGTPSPANVEFSVDAANILPCLMHDINKLRTALRTTVEALEVVNLYNPGGIVVSISITVGRKALTETGKP